MRRSLVRLILIALLACGVDLTGAAERSRRKPGSTRIGTVVDAGQAQDATAFLLAEYFQTNPMDDPDTITAGAAAARLTWELSDPAWPGDHRGSVSALYDSSLAAGLFGFLLPQRLSEQDAFTAAAAFVLDPDEFDADPNGFFQISWGLWNTQTTGLNRTGNFTSFAGDTFELLELDYFPNVSPMFGGPFLSPSLFGVNADSESPDAYGNGSFSFGLQVGLPLGVPLLAVIKHDPTVDIAVISVHRIVSSGRTVPLQGATAVIDLSALGVRKYGFNAVGLTLWNDGFGGPDPAVRVKLELHSLVVERGLIHDVDRVLRLPPSRQ